MRADAFQYTSEEFCADKEVVLAAVQQQGFNLQHAGEEMRGDKEVVLVGTWTDVYTDMFRSVYGG